MSSSTSSTTTDDDLTEAQRKRPRSRYVDYNAILELLSELRDQLDGLPGVADEDMLEQLDRLSRQLHRQERYVWKPRQRSEESEMEDPFARVLYDREIEVMDVLQCRTEDMAALSERSRALGNEHVMSSETFEGLLDTLRNNFMALPRSAHCFVELYLHRVVAIFSETHPNHTLVIRPGQESLTADIEPLRPSSLELYVLRLCPSANAYAYRVIEDREVFRDKLRGMLVVCMGHLNIEQATLEVVNYAKKTQTRTIRGVATDGLFWKAISVTWDEDFLTVTHLYRGSIRSLHFISSADFVVGVLHHWVQHFSDEVGECDKEYFKV